MKFRAKLTDVDKLFNIVAALEKVSKKAILQLTTERLHWIVLPGLADIKALPGSSSLSGAGVGAHAEIQVWSGIKMDSVFEDIILTSNSNNEIGLTLELSNLLRALKSGSPGSMPRFSIKLTKRQNHPYLNITIVNANQVGMNISQDVPIDLVPPARMAEYREPDMPDPVVSICLPDLRKLRTVVDRMKSVSDQVFVKATSHGRLSLQVETSMVSIATHYKDLDNPPHSREEANSRPLTATAVKLDIKRLAKVLHAYAINPASAVLCLWKDSRAVVHVLLGDLYVSYYIPIIAD